jgi:hypothetical protein
LGSTIHDIHQGIIYALGKEQGAQILTLLMRVTTVLVENCSYERLSKKHLPSLYQAVISHWTNIQLRSCILKVLASIYNAAQQGEQADDFINQYLLEAITDANAEIQMEAWRTCTILNKTPALWDKLKDHFNISVASLKFAESYASTVEEDVGWWQVMMENYLQSACSSEVPAVKSAACDCFASMSKDAFEKFHVSLLPLM